MSGQAQASGLNSLIDRTLDDDLSEICGFTASELDGFSASACGKPSGR
jgi:hypothetical protein